MKVRHIAATALMGWYLMMPHWSQDDHAPRDDSPLAQWIVIDSFDFASDCKDAKKAREDETFQRFSAETPEPHNPFQPYQGIAELRRAWYREYLSAQCIGTDDPRLAD